MLNGFWTTILIAVLIGALFTLLFYYIAGGRDKK